MSRKRLIIIGGGFAGISVAKALKCACIDILLIDKKNHHDFQPLLYQVATATLSPKDICVSLREIFAKQKNTTVLMGEVVNIDKSQKQITLGNGDIFDYDYLVIAIGARHSYFGHNEWEKLAPGIKTITDALNIREHILIALEKAERLDSIADSHKYLTFVIVGGGPTGVEFAGTIAELLHRTMKKNYRNIRLEKSRIILVEGTDRILPTFDPKLSIRARKDLEKLGVTVLTKAMVTNITEDGVQIGETFIEAKTVLWAAGNQISALTKTLSCELDRAGRVIVEKDLSLPGHPEIFVLGDAACFMTKKGNILPGVATVALQEGRFVGKLLKQEFKQTKPPRHRQTGFQYFDKGNLATIGTGKAVAAIGKFKFTGLFAWLIWAIVHVAYLISFRNKVSVMIEWVFHHITGMRSSRIIHGTIDENLPRKEN